jgi:hypothetical protein
MHQHSLRLHQLLLLLLLLRRTACPLLSAPLSLRWIGFRRRRKASTLLSPPTACQLGLKLRDFVRLAGSAYLLRIRSAQGHDCCTPGRFSSQISRSSMPSV